MNALHPSDYFTNSIPTIVMPRKISSDCSRVFAERGESSLGTSWATSVRSVVAAVVMHVIPRGSFVIMFPSFSGESYESQNLCGADVLSVCFS